MLKCYRYKVYGVKKQGTQTRVPCLVAVLYLRFERVRYGFCAKPATSEFLASLDCVVRASS